jgi:hypothetical protein
MYFHWKKIQLAQLSKLHLKLKNFFQPAGFFTKMLRFDEKQRNFQQNPLATLKIAPVLMGVTGTTKSCPPSRLCLKYLCPTL